MMVVVVVVVFIKRASQKVSNTIKTSYRNNISKSPLFFKFLEFKGDY